VAESQKVFIRARDRRRRNPPLTSFFFAQDKSVRALLDNYRNQRPLALLIDDKYALFPYQLGAKDMTYVVLGFYTIAHAWGTTSATEVNILLFNDIL